MNEDFKAFLIQAKKKGYASGESATQEEKDYSYSTRYKKRDWSFHDNWFGGEPFGGREVVFYKSKPYWMMVYYGSDSGRAEGLITFLRKSLDNLPEDMPVRGPTLLKDGSFRYENVWDGNLERFSGVEKIFYKGEEVYKAEYIGGLVDRRKDQ